MNVALMVITMLVKVISNTSLFERVKADVFRVNEDMAGLPGDAKRQKVANNTNVFLEAKQHPGQFIINLLIELAVSYLKISKKI